MSKKQKLPDQYLKKADALRRYGFKIKYSKTRYKTPAQKSLITRTWKSVKNYVENTKQDFRFFKAETKKAKKIRGVLSPIQITPKGFFYRVPVNAKSFRLDLDGKDVVVTATGQKGGKRRDVYIKLNPVEIAKDPAQAVKKAIKRVKVKGKYKARIVVAGYDGRFAYPAEYFLNYAPELFRQLLDPERESPQMFGRKLAKGGKKLSPDQIADIFHLKLESQSPSKNAKRSKKPAKRKR